MTTAGGAAPTPEHAPERTPTRKDWLALAVLLARGDDRGAVVVQERLAGRPLDELTPAELTPELLGRVGSLGS